MEPIANTHSAVASSLTVSAQSQPISSLTKIAPVSFEFGLALGSEAPAASIHHYYSGRYNSPGEYNFAQFADMAKRFDSRKSIESLGRHTGGYCVFCATSLFVLNSAGEWTNTIEYEWDHLLPASRLGLTVDGNMCPICSDCNSAKSDKDALAYYRERKQAGKSYFYADEQDLANFLRSFSEPYREAYGDSLYERALENSTNGASETELRVQLAELFVATDRAGDFVLSMAVKTNARLSTSSAEFIEKVKADLFAQNAWKTDTQRTYSRILHKIQYAMDEMVEEGELSSPDMSTIDFDGFYKLAKRVYAAAADLSKPSSRIGEAKKLLSAVADYSPSTPVKTAGRYLATYADYRDNGSILKPIPLAELKGPRTTR